MGFKILNKKNFFIGLFLAVVFSVYGLTISILQNDNHNFDKKKLAFYISGGISLLLAIFIFAVTIDNTSLFK